jgi:hypothetical protein
MEERKNTDPDLCLFQPAKAVGKVALSGPRSRMRSMTYSFCSGIPCLKENFLLCPSGKVTKVALMSCFGSKM